MHEAKSLNTQPIKILRTRFFEELSIDEKSGLQNFERWYVNRNVEKNVKEGSILDIMHS